MYLLKRSCYEVKGELNVNLHSTMYLLKPYTLHNKSLFYQDLHSTMYLLKLIHSVESIAKSVFTFHYVSIKTNLLFKAVLL